MATANLFSGWQSWRLTTLAVAITLAPMPRSPDRKPIRALNSRSGDPEWIERTRELLDEEAARWPGGQDLPPLSQRYRAHRTCRTVGRVASVRETSGRERKQATRDAATTPARGPEEAGAFSS